MLKKLIALLTAALALAACSPARSASEPAAGPDTSNQTSEADTFTVGLTYIPDVQFFPLYVAQQQGYFEAEGLDITLRHHGAQESLLGALQSGEEDVVFAGGDEMAQAASTGVPVVNWATMYQKYPVELIVKADSDIQSWADLEGRAVGLPGPYGENYYGLLAALDAYELTDKVNVEYIGYTQSAALAKDSVAGVIGFSNNDAIAIRNGGIEVREIPLVEGELPLIGVGFGSLKDNVRTDAYAKFLRAVYRGVEAARKDPALALDATAEFVPALSNDGPERELAAKVLDATLELYSDADNFGKVDVTRAEKMSEFLLNSGVITEKISATDIFAQDVMDAYKALK